MTYQKVSASGLILNKEGKLLMVKRSDTDDFLPGFYGLPGGGTDYLEHPTEGLQREIKEECGLNVSIEHPLTAFSFTMNHEGVEKHTVEIVYLCKMEDEQDVKLSFEHSDYKWLGFDEVSNLPNIDTFMLKLINDLRMHPLISTYS